MSVDCTHTVLQGTIDVFYITVRLFRLFQQLAWSRDPGPHQCKRSMNRASRVKFRGSGDKHTGKEERWRKEKSDGGDDSEGSLDPIAVVQSVDKNVMNNMHSSYGTLNNSLNNLSLSAFQSCNSGLNLSKNELQSPASRTSPSPRGPRNKVVSTGSTTTTNTAGVQSSPWGVKLRKTAPQSGAQTSAKTSRLHNYSLLEEFSTPRQWESPVKSSPRKATPSTQIQAMRLPVLELDDASSVTSTASHQSERRDKEVEKKRKGKTSSKQEKEVRKKKHAAKKERTEQDKANEAKIKCKLEQAKRERLDEEKQQRLTEELARLKKREERASIRHAERALRKQHEVQRLADEQAHKVRLEANERKQRQEERKCVEKEEKLRMRHHAKMKKEYQTQIDRLQQQLDAIELETDDKIAAINNEYATKKEDIKQRALQRHVKNKKRPTQEDTTIHEGKDIISLLRRENATIRERNEKLFDEIQKLQTNNQRLELSNAESEQCVARLQFHDETCVTEHSKLVRIEKQYRNAVQDHEDHLELHNQYASAESKICRIYDKALSEVLLLVDKKCGDHALRTEVHEIADFMRDNDTSEVLKKEYE